MANDNAARDKTCVKYLAHYAEPEAQFLASFPAQYNYQHVLVIPAFQETAAFIQRFANSVLAKQQCLLIVVVNQPDSDFGREHQQAQSDLADYISGQGQLLWQDENLRLIDLALSSDGGDNKTAIDSGAVSDSNSAILLVDRFTKPIPADQGVGLARKIGADLAVNLFITGNISSRWIHSSDADAYLPNNYFTAHADQSTSLNRSLNSAVATCCNFYHHAEQQDIHQANLRYENALRYYVAGLAYAKSPYAYFTIGSILSFDMLAYCQARGFPKRSAGEDFYLLNKLAKLGDVAYLSDVIIKLDARPSQRVPFGTGPAVQNIMNLAEQQQDYLYYNPGIFVELKQCISAFESLWQHCLQPQLWLEMLSEPTQQALVSIGLLSFVTKQQSAKQAQFDKQLTVWFDSFKTLKFIHALRDLGFDSILLEQAITDAPFSLLR